MKRISDLLSDKGRGIWSLSPDATVYDAIEQMALKSVGALLVMEGKRLVGIVSERDYARKMILQGRSSMETTVAEIMSSPVITVEPGTTLGLCMHIMTERRVRHLAVVEAGRLVGVITIGDLVRTLLSLQSQTIDRLNTVIAGPYPS